MRMEFVIARQLRGDQESLWIGGAADLCTFGLIGVAAPVKTVTASSNHPYLFLLEVVSSLTRLYLDTNPRKNFGFHT